MTRSLTKLLAGIAAGLASVWIIVGLAVLGLIALVGLTGCVLLSPEPDTEAPATRVACPVQSKMIVLEDSAGVRRDTCATIDTTEIQPPGTP